MSRQSTAIRPVFSASSVLDAIGSDLALIKSEDRLTFADLGAVLGKSEDQAAKYCAGEADMGVVSYARAKREWNGRFTGSLDRLCVETRPHAVAGRTVESKLLKAALALSVALEDDNEIDAAEVRHNRAVIEAARDALDALLGKLRAVA
jgi:hypothetical protein